MSISPVGNVVYVNQQTANVTPLQGNQNQGLTYKMLWLNKF